MINLAGDEKCDVHILVELEKAGITALTLGKPSKNEVAYSWYGILGLEPLDEQARSFMYSHGISPEIAKSFGSFVFTRAWYYWCVSGFVPLHVAEEMYENPNGRKDIRANGHCGCPPPAEELHRHKVCGMDVVSGYHIDSQEGLNYFVQTMLKHGLV